MFRHGRRKRMWERFGAFALSAVLLAGNIAMGMPGLAKADTESAQEQASASNNSVSANNTARSFDASKPDVWDFGAESLGDGYNNRLDVATINGFYSGVAGGTTGKNLASFSVDDGDFVFADGGYSATHRLRTTNTALTRYDAKSLKDSDGNVYSGYIYSNKGSTEAVYVALQCRADDIVTAYVASNGNTSEVHFQNVSDANDDASFVHSLGSGTVSKMVFYAANTAQYKIFSATEKLVVARVIRQHATYSTLSGTVEGFEGTGSFDVVFTNRQNGNVVRATVSDGAFTADLANGFDYDISLAGADTYVITSDKTVNLSGDQNFAMTVESIDLVEVSGSLTGIEAEDAEDFAQKAEFTLAPQDEESVYVPQMELTEANGTVSFAVTLQKNVAYDLSVAGVDDYTLTTTEIAFDGNADNAQIAFEKKPLYDVTITPVGASLSDLAEANFKFTRLDPENAFEEDGYVYEFTGTDSISLRDGIYRVEVSNTGAFVQKLTSNLVVNGASVTKEIGFESDITEWNFSDIAFAEKFAGATSGTYNGLSWTNGKSHNGVYLYSGAGTISVPVKGACQIQVTANYQYSYYFENEEESSVNVKTGSTSQNDTFTYNYTGAAGTVDITVLGTSYITRIATVYQTEYQSELTVGSSDAADYATIGEALDAVRSMNREDGQRVTISIEPGNYEEMLVVDVADVTLANASSNPTNTLKNSGVDIDDNAVRITWYYGHGYTYYSMGSDYKYDAEVFAVNNANGYASVVNPGSGTGTYWNASVVVDAAGFEAKDIIFENSFNQYMSQKAVDDVIVPQSGAKEGSVARNTMAVGDTTVQDKKYVERAAALALTGKATEAYFENCRIVGRQDTLYGHEGTTAAFYNCAVYGGTDYIFGGMTAVFAKCDLVLNTSNDKNDVAYITAAQQKSASSRGYLMYNCTVKSITPGVDTASTYPSKPGQFGRPWQANTSEVVFFDTVVESTNWKLGDDDKYVYDADTNASLIQPAGWNTSLGGQSARNVEYGTYEVSGENNSASRVDWVQQPETAVCADGTAISVATFLGEWDPFAANGKDMTITFPDGTTVEAPSAEAGAVSATTEFVFESKDLIAFDKGAKKDGDTEKAGTEDYFTLIYSASTKVDSSSKTWEDDYTSSQRLNLGGKATTEKNSIKFTTSNSATVKIWWVQGGDDSRQMAILNAAGETVAITEGTYSKNSPYISTLRVDAAGTYYLGGYENNNNIYKVVITEDAVAEPVVSTLEASALATFVAGAKADGTAEQAGTDNFFTILYSSKSKVDSSNKTWDDGYTSGQRINFGGKASAEMNAVKFTTSSADAEVKIWWVEGGDDKRQMVILDSTGTAVVKTAISDPTKNTAYLSTLTIPNPGTYYLGGDTGSNYIFKIQVTDGAAAEVVRADWATVAAPVISSVALDSTNANNILVTVNSLIGANGGDKLVVDMMNADGTVVKSLTSAAEKESFDFAFAPSVSGTYTFKATLTREDEETAKDSAVSEAVNFVLPLTAPQIKNATNKGNGSVTVKFYSVSEATGYDLVAESTGNSGDRVEVSYTPETVVINVTTEYAYTFEGLTVGETYRFSVLATRGNDRSAVSTLEIEVTDEEEMEWTFSAFGQGVDSNSKNAGYTVNNDDTITVWNLNNKGKIVPASTDGLAFYYATIPADMNFTLTATATIDSWTFTNGQEGFGLMACDRVGVNGDSSVFWNNSYMASGTKVEYYYDTVAGQVTDDTGAAKITMKNGLGAQEKKGVTLENLSRLEANDTATVTGEFSSKMYPLETSCGASGAGTYNIWGNESSGTASTVANPLTQVTLRIQKNNTGYFVSVLDENGNVLNTKKFYDTEALEKLDADHVYAGFFASRTFKVTFSNIELTLVAPEDDVQAEDRPTTYVTPSYSIISAEHSNTAGYALQYTGNADGILTITDGQGKTLVDHEAFLAGAVKTVNTTLTLGNNTFDVVFTPDSNFHPEGDAYQLLSSYETASFRHTVVYKTISEAEEIFVSPNGSASGAGTQADPVDIYTAVKFIQPGQTIRLAGGTYSLRSTVTVARGIDGTATKPIRMIADPEDRAVFDFNNACAGFVLAGDYWYISGIDCTRSGNSLKGIQLSGSHCTLEDIHTYENGNTGIQVSRYLSSDSREEWPSYDLILNCTSYSNADAGYEDADGFAAKLTVGDGIVFDGCVAYNNADDGWDLFAKVETGPIGQVTIRNSVAFANGYGVDGTNEGNGNGFKMGGSSISGKHILINSAAWGNKAKGIDSNSCPDIQVYHSTSFNNGSYNVALYTNDTANTDFYVDGVMSYRTTATDVNENIKQKGTQDSTKIYSTQAFFWNNGKSENTAGLTVSDSWFVSLNAPYANVNDPLAVAQSLRAADGRIDLGSFLKLSEEGIAALTAAGLDYRKVVAVLDGQYEALKDQSQIAGSQEDQNQVEEPAAEEPTAEEPAAEEPASEDPGTGESGSGENSNAENSSDESGNTDNGSGESSNNENSSDESSDTDNDSTESTGNTGSQSGSQSSNTQSSSSTGDSEVTAQAEEESTAITTRPARVVTAPEVGRETGNDEVQIPDEPGLSQEPEEEIHALEEEQVATTDQISGEGSSENPEGQQPAMQEPAPKEEQSFPVVPVAAAAGGTVVVAAAAVVAVKTGLMAKILAALGIVK